MTITNHVVMGGLVATFAHNPLIAIPVALASHFALDSLPHFDYPTQDPTKIRFFIWLAIDAGLAASILTAIFILQPAGASLILVCAIVAASPDLMWAYYLVYKNGKNRKNWPLIVKFHSSIQKHTSPKLWPIELVWLLATGTLLVSRLY